ncbi:MAG TPA: protein-L-isoaspartate(D-aspartate) O-methyltransferase [Spirochaetota bacterium]|nr:protein-L-isoaspartate(D-aspartate) O-methyltransferase [Spirochaetota bacterium]
MYHNSDSMYRPRLAMVEKLQQKGISSGSVLEAMLRVPRHLFVSDALCYRAYDDTSLPIGFGQTISTPSVVASMVQSLKLTGDEKVLEIGSGSGYQAALLAELSSSVTAMERIPELAERSRSVLGSLGYTVRVITDDDFNVIDSLFDRIIVAAGVAIMPYNLLEKLEPGGILIIPVNENGSGHRIKRFVRKKDNDYFEEVIGMATFVPYITSRMPV